MYRISTGVVSVAEKGEKDMLIENTVFNFHEVGEKSIEKIKNECLVSFAVNLKIALTSNQESIRKFWSESLTDVSKGSIANYKIFQDEFGSRIKYNSKSIVFEETLHNELRAPWSVRQTCMDVYGLEYVEATKDTSAYYKYRDDGLHMTCDTCCCEFVGDKREDYKERLRHFYTAFGVGEFPFMTITLIRLGNKDHYFYRIHR